MLKEPEWVEFEGKADPRAKINMKCPKCWRKMRPKTDRATGTGFYCRKHGLQGFIKVK